MKTKLKKNFERAMKNYQNFFLPAWFFSKGVVITASGERYL